MRTCPANCLDIRLYTESLSLTPINLTPARPFAEVINTIKDYELFTQQYICILLVFSIINGVQREHTQIKFSEYTHRNKITRKPSFVHLKCDPAEQRSPWHQFCLTLSNKMSGSSLVFFTKKSSQESRCFPAVSLFRLPNLTWLFTAAV